MGIEFRCHYGCLGWSYWQVFISNSRAFLTVCVALADLPLVIRNSYANNLSAVDLESFTAGHVDIPRLRAGKVGGFFWSVYVFFDLREVHLPYMHSHYILHWLNRSIYTVCPKKEDEGDDFTNATWAVRYADRNTEREPDVTYIRRDSLEQIDVARLLINKYPNVSLFIFLSSIRLC